MRRLQHWIVTRQARVVFYPFATEIPNRPRNRNFIHIIKICMHIVLIWLAALAYLPRLSEKEQALS